jgi:hypothetical protein
MEYGVGEEEIVNRTLVDIFLQKELKITSIFYKTEYSSSKGGCWGASAFPSELTGTHIVYLYER